MYVVGRVQVEPLSEIGNGAELEGLNDPRKRMVALTLDILKHVSRYAVSEMQF